jgi:ADP-ribosyl-[dinitrogen reductase] hydrolase
VRLFLVLAWLFCINISHVASSLTLSPTVYNCLWFGGDDQNTHHRYIIVFHSFILAVQDGLVLPTIVALTGVREGMDDDSIQRAAAECVSVTRRSSVLQRVSSQWAKVVVAAVRTNEGNQNQAFEDVLGEFAKQTIRRLPNHNVDDASTMSACYLDSALPGLIDMAAKYSSTSTTTSTTTSSSSNNILGERAWQGLLSNANVGGENVHRGSVLGAILGARAGYHQLPSELVRGLYPQSELQQEIDDFVHAILSKKE